MRLIDKDKLYQKAMDIIQDKAGWKAFAIANAISMAETVEAEPVRYGNWQLMNDTYDRWKDYTCSECHCCVSRKYNYCPNCGAKMDGGRK